GVWQGRAEVLQAGGGGPAEGAVVPGEVGGALADDCGAVGADARGVGLRAVGEEAQVGVGVGAGPEARFEAVVGRGAGKRAADDGEAVVADARGAAVAGTGERVEVLWSMAQDPAAGMVVRGRVATLAHDGEAVGGDGERVAGNISRERAQAEDAALVRPEKG